MNSQAFQKPISKAGTGDILQPPSYGGIKVAQFVGKSYEI
jgi:hypothetical protein